MKESVKSDKPPKPKKFDAKKINKVDPVIIPIATEAIQGSDKGSKHSSTKLVLDQASNSQNSAKANEAMEKFNAEVQINIQ